MYVLRSRTLFDAYCPNLNLPLSLGLSSLTHTLPFSATLSISFLVSSYATGFFGKWHVGSLTNATTPDCQPAVNGTCTPGYVLIRNNTLCCDGRDAHVPVMRPIDVGFHTALATPQVAPAGTANCGCVGTVPGAGTGCMLGHYEGLGHFPPSQPWLECDQYFNSTPSARDMLSVQHVTPEDDAAFLVDSFLAFATAAVREGKPFFAQISFHNNHIPYLSPAKFRSLYPGYDLNHQDYYGGLSAVDEQVGRIRKALSSLGVANNTFLALTSDNGPEVNVGGHETATFYNPGDNGGRTGRKRALTEGGIRLTGIIEYPPLVKENRVDMGTFPVVTNDFLPTLLDIVGGHPTHPSWPLDGVSLLPVLSGHVVNRSMPIGWYSHYPWVIVPPEQPPYQRCFNRPKHPLPPSFPRGFRTPFDQPRLAWTEGVYKLFACSDTPKLPESWRFSLYNVLSDDKEQHDLWPQLRSSTGDAMFRRFLQWQESVLLSIEHETNCRFGSYNLMSGP